MPRAPFNAWWLQCHTACSYRGRDPQRSTVSRTFLCLYSVGVRRCTQALCPLQYLPKGRARVQLRVERVKETKVKVGARVAARLTVIEQKLEALEERVQQQGWDLESLETRMQEELDKR